MCVPAQCAEQRLFIHTDTGQQAFSPCIFMGLLVAVDQKLENTAGSPAVVYASGNVLRDHVSVAELPGFVHDAARLGSWHSPSTTLGL